MIRAGLPWFNRRMRTWLTLAACSALLGGCVDVPARIVFADAAPGVAPNDGGAEAEAPRPDAGPVVDAAPRDAAPPLDRGVPDAAPPAPDRGPVDADPPDPPPPDAEPPPECAGGSVAFDALGLCVRAEPCGALPAPRAGHRIVRLPDDRVLLAGGWTLDDDEVVMPQETWLADAAADRWAPTGNGLREGRVQHTLTRIPGGDVIMAGGDERLAEWGDAPRDRADRFAVQTGTWSNDDNPHHRARHAAAWSGDRLWIDGGFRNDDDLQGTEHRRDGENWSDARGGLDPPTRLWDHQLVGIEGGGLLRFGGRGFDDGGEPRANAQMLRFDGDAWTAVGDPLVHVDGATVWTPIGMALIGGDIAPEALVGASAAIRRLDTIDFSAPVVATAAVARRLPGASRVGPSERVLIAFVGGEAGAETTLEIVDLETGAHGAWVLSAAFDGHWAEPQGVRLVDGRAIFVGGLVAGAPSDRCVRIEVTPR